MKHWTGPGHIDVRIGNEKVGQTYEKRLTTNNMCGRYYLTKEIHEHKISITCKSRLFGRYLSIQKKTNIQQHPTEKFGVLEIKGISSYPLPSN